MTGDVTTAVEELAKRVNDHTAEINSLKQGWSGCGCKMLSQGDACQCAKCYTDRSIRQVLEDFDEFKDEMRRALASHFPNQDPQVGVCTICNCAIWQHQARVNNDHQVCQLIRRAEIAEKALEEERENRLKSADQNEADLKALRNGEEVYFSGLGLRSLNVPNRILEQELQDYKNTNEDLKDEINDHEKRVLELEEELAEQKAKHADTASSLAEALRHFKEAEKKAKILDRLVRQEKVDVKGNGKQWVLVGWEGRYDDVLKDRDKYKELYENLLKEYTEVQMEILRLSQRINGQ